MTRLGSSALVQPSREKLKTAACSIARRTVSSSFARPERAICRNEERR